MILSTLLMLVAVDMLLANFYGLFPMEIWDANTTSLLFRAAMWSGFVWYLIPYKSLAAKSVASIFFLTQVLDLLQYQMPSIGKDIMMMLSFVAFAPMMGYAAFRRYSLPSDDLVDSHVCIIARRPDRFTGFLASVFGQPFGRYAYYVNGAVFHFHHGKFKMTYGDHYPIADATIIKTNIKVTGKVREQFARSIGSRWSLWNNCVTMRLRNVHQ